MRFPNQFKGLELYCCSFSFSSYLSSLGKKIWEKKNYEKKHGMLNPEDAWPFFLTSSIRIVDWWSITPLTFRTHSVRARVRCYSVRCLFKINLSRKALHWNNKDTRKKYRKMYGPTPNCIDFLRNKILSELTEIFYLIIIFVFFFSLIVYSIYWANPWTLAIHDHGSFQTLFFVLCAFFESAFPKELFFFSLKDSVIEDVLYA